jgi:hypothetical protein
LKTLTQVFGYLNILSNHGVIDDFVY